MAQTNRYIDDVDLTESTSLAHLLDRYSRDSDIDETHIIRHSPYYSETQFKQLISNKAGSCILDLNVQNVFTKFDELESFVNRVNVTHPISAICLNECWINDIDSMTGLNLPNYQMFFQPGNGQGHSHCGLVIYVHNQFNANDITAQLDVEHTGYGIIFVWKYHTKSQIE